MDAFIVRPFGEREGVNFDKVQTELIEPALKAAGFTEIGTTEIAVEAGNIRYDMIHKLLTADIVIADLSLLNANVWYELGVRHALRDKYTVHIRCEVDGHAYPFDLKPDRYLPYDAGNPAAARDALTKTIEATLGPEHRADSPIYYILPDLRPPDFSKLRGVPSAFVEDVRLAAAGDPPDAGLLRLLSIEARDQNWAVEGLREVGREQFRIKAYEAAQETWEYVCDRPGYRRDKEANQILATVYERLHRDTGDRALLEKSNHAVQRVLERPTTTHAERAECHALLGRNHKTRWLAAWRSRADDPAGRREAALRDFTWNEALEHYAEGHHSDLNHFYSGINVLFLTTILVELAKSNPDTWASLYANPEAARCELLGIDKSRSNTASVVECAVDVALQQDPDNVWALMSRADLALLNQEPPPRVEGLYTLAAARLNAFATDAAIGQLRILQELGILEDQTAAAMDALMRQLPPRESPFHAVVFAGHMLDKPNRSAPRFPNTAEAIASARDAIAAQLDALKSQHENLMGFAGAACGGDTIFHELCAERGISTTVLLALPKDAYRVSSVAFGGSDWISRFEKLIDSLPVRVLQQSEALPSWLASRDNYSVWQRANLWILYNAFTGGGRHATLLALWDGQSGDGPGGTSDMVDQAEACGAATIVLNSRELFGL